MTPIERILMSRFPQTWKIIQEKRIQAEKRRRFQRNINILGWTGRKDVPVKSKKELIERTIGSEIRPKKQDRVTRTISNKDYSKAEGWWRIQAFKVATSPFISNISRKNIIQQKGFKIPPDIEFLKLEKEYKYAVYTGDVSTFQKTYETKFETLAPVKKFEYGLRFGEIGSKSVREWKYYEGGLEYIRLHKEDLVGKYLKEEGPLAEVYGFSSWQGKHTILGIFRTKDYIAPKEDIEYQRYQAWLNIGYLPDEQKEIQFSQYPQWAKVWSSTHHSFISASLYPVTLTQLAVKYIRGEGALTDPLSRIKTGKTYLPDVAEKLEIVQAGGPRGLLSVGISEGVASATGQKSREWHRFQKDPLAGVGATVGEFLGMYAGGKGVHILKVGIVRGMGKLRTGIVAKTGWEWLPTYKTMQKYGPVNLYRKYKYGLGSEKQTMLELDAKFGRTSGAYIEITDAGTIFQRSALPNKLSFIGGGTPYNRIQNTIKAFEKTYSRTGGKLFIDKTPKLKHGVFEDLHFHMFYLKDIQAKKVIFDLDRTLMIRSRTDIVLRSGAENILKSLKSEGIGVGLWTHGTRKGVIGALKKTGIYKYFDDIVTREQYAMGLGPNTMKNIKLIGGDILIEDNPIIANLVRQSGQKVIMVPRMSYRYLGLEQRMVTGIKEVIIGGEKVGYIGIHATTRGGLTGWYKPLVWMHKGRESLGVSFAPLRYGNPQFLRIGGKALRYESAKLSLLPKIKMPTGILLHFKEIKELPSNLAKMGYSITTKEQRNVFYQLANKYLKKQTGVFVAPKMYAGGPEPELIARGFTMRLGVRYFTRIEGIIVPLPEFKLLGEKITTTGIMKQNIKQFLSPISYTDETIIPLIRPSYAGSLSAIYRPSMMRSIQRISSGSSYAMTMKSIPSLSSIPSNIRSIISGSRGPSGPSGPSIPSITSIPSIPSGPSGPSGPSYPSIPSYSIISIPSHPSPPSIPSIYSPPDIPSYPVTHRFPIYFEEEGPRIVRLQPMKKFEIGYTFREFKIPDLLKGISI